MLVREFPILAATIAGHAPAIIRRSPGLSEQQLHAYWVASRSRLNRWGAQLRRLQLLQASGSLSSAAGAEEFHVVWEVLFSEMVTRVWCATLDGIDERLELQEYSPIGRSVHAGHLEARQRVLQLLVGAHRDGPVSFWSLNQTRIFVERWTDLLLSCMPMPGLAGRYCFDDQRLLTYHASGAKTSRHGSSASLLVLAASEWFPTSLTTCAANDDLHTRVHQAILGCLATPLFSGTGVWEGRWSVRMECVTDELLSQLASWLGPSPAAIDPPRGSEGSLGRF
jgi:hypothetical protein